MTADLPAKSRTVVFRRMDEGGVLFCTRNEVYFGVNGVGAVIWDQLPDDMESSDSPGLEELLDRLQEVFPQVDRNRLATDVQEFLTELEESELVAYGESNGTRS